MKSFILVSLSVWITSRPSLSIRFWMGTELYRVTLVLLLRVTGTGLPRATLALMQTETNGRVSSILLDSPNWTGNACSNISSENFSCRYSGFPDLSRPCRHLLQLRYFPHQPHFPYSPRLPICSYPTYLITDRGHALLSLPYLDQGLLDIFNWPQAYRKNKIIMQFKHLLLMNY